MKRTLGDELLPTPTQLPESELPPAIPPETTPEQTRSEPTLLNRTATNPSIEIVAEVNQPSIQSSEHSAPEKSDRSSVVSSVALSSTTEDSLENLKQAALSGNADAMFKIGRCYGEGRGIEKNIAEAFQWYHRAAEQGHAEAQFSLMPMYYKGEGVEVNKVKAVEWCQKAAEQGLAKAQFNLGFMYFKGEGVEFDLAKAVEWHRKAAEQGHAEAQSNLGFMYFKGEGVEVNKVKAVEWYHKAADQGHAKAQFNLGVKYEKGVGVEVDLAKAVEWYHKAADQGYAKAQLRVSQCYREGVGVGKDLSLATYWRIKSGLGSSANTFSLDDDHELIKLIPNVMEKYSECKRIEKIRLSVVLYFTQEHTATIANFIRSNHKVGSLLIHSYIKVVNEDQLSVFIEALKFNTNLILLEFPRSKLSSKMKDQIKVLLAQNRDIAELRQYVKKHPLIFTADIPFDVVKILDKQIIVSTIKSGQTKEATKKAIDEFLIVARTTPLAKDSKIT